jgi:hypothetical protein
MSHGEKIITVRGLVVFIEGDPVVEQVEEPDIMIGESGVHAPPGVAVLSSASEDDENACSHA